MVDFKAALTNPWVIGGGAALALVLLLTSRGGSSGDQVVTTGTVSNYSGAEWASQAAQIAATVNIAGVEARTTERLKLFDTLAGFMAVQQTVAGQMAESAAGITRTRIETDAMLRLDRQQGDARYQEIVKTTDAALTLSQRQSDLEELRIRESSNLSRMTIDSDAKRSINAFALTERLAGIGAKTERKQIAVAGKVGVAQARAAQKTGVAQAEAAPWVSFWDNIVPAATQLASSAMKLA
jgi:hypothetical protein